MSQSVQQSQNQGALENRLEQIKQNIKAQRGVESQKSDISDLMEKYSPSKSQNNKSIEDLESVLRQ